MKSFHASSPNAYQLVKKCYRNEEQFLLRTAEASGKLFWFYAEDKNESRLKSTILSRSFQLHQQWSLAIPFYPEKEFQE